MVTGPVLTAAKLILPPEHTVEGVAVAVTVVAGDTPTVFVAVTEHKFASFTVTV